MNDFLGTETLESMSQAVWYNQWTLEKFRPFLKGEILEVGCGIGNFTPFLTKFGKVTAIDIKKEYIRETKKKTGYNIEVGLGDIEKGKYFFKGKRFDVIVCLNVLEHIEKDTQALSNMNQLLKKEGHLVLLLPAHMFLYAEIDKAIGHFRRYSRVEIIDKLHSSNFELQFTRQLNFIGALGWFISGRLLRNKKVDGFKIKLFNFFSPLFLRIEDLIEPIIGTSFLVVAKKK